METLYKICVMQNKDEKVKHFVKVTTVQPDFNGFMAIIFDRFPQLKTVQFYMFYDDWSDEKVIISTASDYNIFNETRSGSGKTVYIVMDPAKTSSFGISYENFQTPPQNSDVRTEITEKLEKFMENVTKENDEFKSRMLVLMTKIEEMLNRNQQITSIDVPNCDIAPIMDDQAERTLDPTICENVDDAVGAEKYPIITITDSDENDAEPAHLATAVSAETAVPVDSEVLDRSVSLVSLDSYYGSQEMISPATQNEPIPDLDLGFKESPTDKDNASNNQEWTFIDEIEKIEEIEHYTEEGNMSDVSAMSVYTQTENAEKPATVEEVNVQETAAETPEEATPEEATPEEATKEEAIQEEAAKEEGAQEGAPSHSNARVQKAIDTLTKLGYEVGPSIVELLEIVEGDISNILELLG